MMGALRLKCSKDVIIFESVTKSSRARKKFSFIFFPINCLEDTKKKKKKGNSLFRKGKGNLS